MVCVYDLGSILFYFLPEVSKIVTFSSKLINFGSFSRFKKFFPPQYGLKRGSCPKRQAVVPVGDKFNTELIMRIVMRILSKI